MCLIHTHEEFFKHTGQQIKETPRQNSQKKYQNLALVSLTKLLQFARVSHFNQDMENKMVHFSSKSVVNILTTALERAMKRVF